MGKIKLGRNYSHRWKLKMADAMKDVISYGQNTDQQIKIL